MRSEVDLGRQAYVVYPVIEESETQAMKAAQQMFEHLSTEVFPDIPVGLLHGKLGSGEKEAAMDAFKAGRTKILVSTTVIEVGVRRAERATVMVIEQAERFGLSQLHQLRGRVGRGADQSYCMLITEKLNETGKERIRTMVESQDGFAIAEMDLKLRGPGEFFGTKQSGLPSLHIANILRDPDILSAARHEAKAFVERPPSSEDFARRSGLHTRSLAETLWSGVGRLTMRVIAGEYRSRKIMSMPETISGPRRIACARHSSISSRHRSKTVCLWMCMREPDRLASGAISPGRPSRDFHRKEPAGCRTHPSEPVQL